MKDFVFSLCRPAFIPLLIYYPFVLLGFVVACFEVPHAFRRYRPFLGSGSVKSTRVGFPIINDLA